MLDPNNKELIAKQKQLLNKRLGLDVAEGLGITADEELFKEEDLLTKSEKNVSLTAHVSMRVLYSAPLYSFILDGRNHSNQSSWL